MPPRVISYVPVLSMQFSLVVGTQGCPGYLGLAYIWKLSEKALNGEGAWQGGARLEAMREGG